ncbi:MAG: hypothetical protein GY796_35360 [Chloroflexi bacterium]|nr:hypothetical protein [Chloroflexota bacterium]
MNETVTRFIHRRHIDSFQKLYVLLFLAQHPESKGTSQKLAEQLFLGDISLLEKIKVDLQQVGLLIDEDFGWELTNEPDIRRSLEYLVKVFEQPLARQKLLEEIRHS